MLIFKVPKNTLHSEVAWDGLGYVHDLAILFLKEEFQLTEHISPICLPLDSSEYNSDKCFVSGFGKNASGVYQTTLQNTEVENKIQPYY